MPLQRLACVSCFCKVICLAKRPVIQWWTGHWRLLALSDTGRCRRCARSIYLARKWEDFGTRRSHVSVARNPRWCTIVWSCLWRSRRVFSNSAFILALLCRCCGKSFKLWILQMVWIAYLKQPLLRTSNCICFKLRSISISRSCHSTSLRSIFKMS